MIQKSEEDQIIPIVARPPHFKVPKRRKGTENVVTPGATSRMTMTFSGSGWRSLLDDMVEDYDKEKRVEGLAIVIVIALAIRSWRIQQVLLSRVKLRSR